MAEWKKVVVSGSSAELSSLTLDTQLAVAQGGTGLNTGNLSGQAGKSLAVNVGETGFTFADASAPAGTVSSSAQTIANLPSGTVSGSGQVVLQSADKTGFTGATSITTLGTVAAGDVSAILPSGTVSGSAQITAGLPSGTVSGSGQVVLQSADKTGFTGATSITTLGTVAAGDVSAILPSGTVSGSAQITAGLPSGIVSGSSAGDAQGQFKLNGANVSVKDLSTTSNVTFANLTATGDTNLNGNVTLGDQTTDTVTVNGDLTVKGTASFQNTENLLVKDAFITLNSGSNTATDDGGIVVETSTANGGQGPAFAWNGGDGRWGIAATVQSDATSYSADAFMSAVVIGGGASPAASAPAAAYVKAGNIYAGTDESLWIYSA